MPDQVDVQILDHPITESYVGFLVEEGMQSRFLKMNQFFQHRNFCCFIHCFSTMMFDAMVRTCP